MTHAPSPLRDAAAIVGIGQTEFAKRIDRPESQLAAEAIVAALYGVFAGLVVLDSRAVGRILERRAAPSPSGPPTGDYEALTRREHEVLQLIAQGLPNKTIAAELGISEHTVKFHVGSILAKLEASSRAEAVARAARQGLIVL